MEDLALIHEVLCRLGASIRDLRKDLGSSLPILSDYDAAEPAEVFSTLAEPLDRAMAVITKLEDDGTMPKCDEAPDWGSDEAEEGSKANEDPVAVLLQLDARLSRLLIEIGFSLTMTAGRLPVEVHKGLSGLLSSAEAARRALDTIAERNQPDRDLEI